MSIEDVNREPAGPFVCFPLGFSPSKAEKENCAIKMLRPAFRFKWGNVACLLTKLTTILQMTWHVAAFDAFYCGESHADSKQSPLSL